MTNWRPTPSQRAVLAIAGVVLLYYAAQLYTDDRSATLPLLAGALLLTASLAGSYRVESLASGSWQHITQHWKALLGVFLVLGIAVGVIVYRNEVIRRAQEKHQEADFAVAQKARQARDRKISKDFEDCVTNNSMEIAKKVRDGIVEPGMSTFWIEYGEHHCAYIRNKATPYSNDPVGETIRAMDAPRAR